MLRLGSRCWLACMAAAPIALTGGASPAAALAIGQLAPAPVDFCEVNPYDLVQPAVGSGNSYVVPATGGVTSWTVTSWSTNRTALPAGQSAALKFFRKTPDPSTFTAVAHEGPHALTAGVNAFRSDLRVKAGDILGANVTGGGACGFTAPGETLAFEIDSNLGDGQSAAFRTVDNGLLNATAEITPTSDFTLGGFQLNKKKGTAVLTVKVPNPGELTGTGNAVVVAGVASTSTAVNGPGEFHLLIAPAGKKQRKLRRKGRVKVNPTITYTPTAGAPGSQSIQLKLKRKLKKR